MVFQIFSIEEHLPFVSFLVAFQPFNAFFHNINQVSFIGVI